MYSYVVHSTMKHQRHTGGNDCYARQILLIRLNKIQTTRHIIISCLQHNSIESIAAIKQSSSVFLATFIIACNQNTNATQSCHKTRRVFYHFWGLLTEKIQFCRCTIGVYLSELSLRTFQKRSMTIRRGFMIICWYICAFQKYLCQRAQLYGNAHKQRCISCSL